MIEVCHRNEKVVVEVKVRPVVELQSSVLSVEK